MSGDGVAVDSGASIPTPTNPTNGKKKKLGKKERARLKAIADGTYVAPVLPQKAPPKVKQPRNPYNGGMAPSLLTKYIKDAWDTSKLLQTCEQYVERMNKIHASASWNMLGRLAAVGGDEQWFITDRVALDTLAKKTIELVDTAAEDILHDDNDKAPSQDPRMGARELANVVHGLAKCGAVTVAEDSSFEGDQDVKTENLNDNDASPLRALIKSLARALTNRGAECNAQETANSAWAFVKLGHVADSGLFTTLSASAIRCAQENKMNAQEIVNAAWAFSKVDLEGGSSEDVMDSKRSTFQSSINVCIDALGNASIDRLSEFDARGVCNLTCALAKTAQQSSGGNIHASNLNTHTNALTALSNETRTRVLSTKHEIFANDKDTTQFSARDIAASSWAFATLEVNDESLFLALAESSIEKIKNSEFDARGLANVAWAHAKTTIAESEIRQNLFKHLSKALQKECEKAKSASFYATTSYESGGSGGNNSLTSRDVANTAWAFAKACCPDDELFAALLQVTTIHGALEKFNNQDLVNTAWAFAKLAVRESNLLLKAMRSTIKTRAEQDTLTATNICTIVWAISSGGGGVGGTYKDNSGIIPQDFSFAEVTEALAYAAERASYESPANQLAATAWTFADGNIINQDLFKTLSKRVTLILLNSGVNDQDFFGDEELDNLEWAFSKAGNPGNVLKVIKSKKKEKGLGMVGDGKSNGFDPSGDPSLLNSSALGTGGDGKSSPVGDPKACGTIVVSGGGIGGAACAVALQKQGFSVFVLESDTGFDSRKQGYGLTVQGTDLRDGLGIDLAKDDAPSTSHYTFQSDGSILGFYGEAFGKKNCAASKSKQSGGNSTSSARFAHVPRQILRLRMLEQVQEGTIKWGCKMKSFAVKDDCKNPGVTVTLDDGSTIDACLLIGSDGIFSTTRRLLNLKQGSNKPDTLTYVGLVVSLGIVYDTEFTVSLAKERIFETVDGSARIYAMPFTTNSTMWQLSFPCGEEEAKLYSKDVKKLKSKLLELTNTWHEPVPSMLLRTELENMSGYPVYDRDPLEPDTLRPPNQLNRRVTLMGDAAHPMTPFKAQGANQAVADAVLLARCLAEGVHRFGARDGIGKSLPVFETKMLQRANRVVKSSREKAREMHSMLALTANRKSQRDAKGDGQGVDMALVISRCRTEGVNAKHASENINFDFDEIVERVGFSGATLSSIGVEKDLAGTDSDSKKEKSSKKQKKERNERKRDSPDGENEKSSKKAKKAKRDRQF